MSDGNDMANDLARGREVLLRAGVPDADNRQRLVHGKGANSLKCCNLPGILGELWWDVEFNAEAWSTF